MASTYSPLLRLELMTTGEKNGQWGDITNTNLSSILEQAIAGTVSISITGASSPITLTENYGTTDQSRTAILSITGTNASPVQIVAPANSKLYYVNNASNQSVTIKTSTSTGTSVAAGVKQFVFFDVSTNDFAIATPTGTAGTVTSVAFSGGTTGLTVSGSPVTSSGTITLGGTLAIANGGTGAFTQGGAINNLLPSQTGQAGKFLTTNGTDVSWATAGSGGVGTVTSVQVSGGSTGMTFTGGPITTSGTISMGGTLGVGFGGTGATTLTGAGIVTTSDSQTITGAKNFTGAVDTVATSVTFLLRNQSYATIGGFASPFQSIYSTFFGVESADTGIKKQAGQEALVVNANSVGRYIGSDGGWFPVSDNSYVCGANGNRWSAIWAANGTIQTSDERQKTDITESSLGLDFIKALRPVSYKWVVGGNDVQRRYSPEERDQYYEENKALPDDYWEPVITPRAGRRTHYGLIAQEVKQVLGNVDFGGYVYDASTDQYALRYDQFVAPLIKAVQELTAKVEELERRLSA